MHFLDPRSLPDVFEYLTANPNLFSVWGEPGVGKTTFCLTYAKSLIEAQGKVLMINTRRTNLGLIQRILAECSPERQTSLVPLYVSSFKKLVEAIFRLKTQMRQEQLLLPENLYKLVIVDCISELYLLELGSEKKNDMLTKQLNFLFATLKELALSEGIPVLITNTSKRSRFEQGSADQCERPFSHIVQHGGDYTLFWIKQHIRLKRSSKLQQRKLHLIDEQLHRSVAFSINLTPQGFQT